MDFTVAGTLISERAMHSLKARAGTAVKDFPNFATVSLTHPSKALSPIVLKPSGKSKAVNDLQLRNALAPMDFSPLPTVTSVTLEQFWKARSPIVVIASGNVNFVTFLQPLKASLPTSCISSPRFNVVNFEHS